MKTIGICSDCGKRFDLDDPRIGYFCDSPVQVESKDKDGKPITVTKKCKGAVIRHRALTGIMETVSGI